MENSTINHTYQTKMEMSGNIEEIAKALISFHKEMKPVKKESKNPFFKSAYADLSSILEAVNEPLQKAGLSFVQFPVGENTLTTMLMHESGQWIQSNYKMEPSKKDPQGTGSAITYARRYALGAILGISTEEDDDGNKANGNSENKKKDSMENPPFGKGSDEDEIDLS